MSEFNKLVAALHLGVVEIRFTKEDGSERLMRATLNESLIGSDKAMGDDPIVIWDMDKSAWRSFRFDRLEHWEVGHLYVKDGYDPEQDTD